MRSFGWEPEIDVVAPGRPNVIATIDGGAPGPTLMFEGHLDVVTEGDPGEWTHDPFGAELVDGRIWGRGAADMKAGVAAMLFAADELCRRGGFPGRLVLGALVDEEGMMIGAKDFVARGRAGRRRRRHLLRARGRRDLPRRQGCPAPARRADRQDGPRRDAVPGPQSQPRRRQRADRAGRPRVRAPGAPRRAPPPRSRCGSRRRCCVPATRRR